MSIRSEIIASALLSIGIAIAVTVFTTHYMHLRDEAAVGELRGGKIERTDRILTAGEQSETQRVKVDIGVADSRNQYERKLGEAEAHEPELIDRAAVPVPERVRNLARERRLARERSARLQEPDAH